MTTKISGPGNAKVVLIVFLAIGFGVAMIGAAATLLYLNRDKLGFLPGGKGNADEPHATAGHGERPVVASAPIPADEQTYRRYLGRDDVLVMVDYYADWCGPCRGIAPSLSRLASAHGDKVVILKVDVDREPSLASAAGIRSIPDVRLLHNGRQLERSIGGRDYAHYESIVLKHAHRLPAPDPATPQPSITPLEKDWLPPGVQPTGS